MKKGLLNDSNTMQILSHIFHFQGGHDKAAKASIKLRNTNSAIEKLVREYNLLQSANQITFDMAKDVDSELYQGMVTNTNVPYSLLKEIVMSSNRMKRCDEEMAALKIELPALLDYQSVIHHLLEDTFNNADLSKGAKSCVYKRLCGNELDQANTTNSIRKAMPDEQVDCTVDTAFLDHRLEMFEVLSHNAHVREVDEPIVYESDSEESDVIDDDDEMATDDEDLVQYNRAY